MKLKNDERIVQNPEQCEEIFNPVLEQNANRNSAFDENGTNFSQSINTSTVSIKEECANSIFVGEDSFVEAKIKIEEHDLYHKAAHLFDKTFYYNKDNIEKDLYITSKCVNSAKEFDNFSSDELKQGVKIDSTLISSTNSDGDCSENINWKLDVENNIDLLNLNKNCLLSEVSFSNDNESNSSEILSEEKSKHLKRNTDRQLKESVIMPLNNIKISNFKFNVVERCTQKKTSAELLGTIEELYIYLQQQDLYKLQRTFRRNQSESKESEKGIRHQCNNACRPKMFSCRFCEFKSDTKYQHAVHIIKNHKEVAKAKNMTEIQYITPGSSPDKILFKCNECSYMTNVMTKFKEHLLIHKSVDELERTYRCASCPFVAKSRPGIISHVLVHVPPERQFIHKCPHCDFRANHKQYVTRHIHRMHNSKLQVKYRAHLQKGKGRYKCPQCPYRTDCLYTLKKVHSVKHTSDEARVHACPLCSYKAKSKGLLRSHMLTHKTPDEVIMYKCDLCPFSTRYKQNLGQHRMIHMEVSEEDMIPCSLCPFKAKNRNNLRDHMRTHQDPSQVVLHGCDQCSFQSRYKSSAKIHSLIHKKAALPTFQCDYCEYKTTINQYLRTHHKLMHDWKRCDKCDFKTKTRGNLKLHSIIHKKPEELQKFECAQCPFSTKLKFYLKRHMVKHTNFYYNCPMCSFKTKSCSSFDNHKRNIHEEKSGRRQEGYDRV